MVKTSLNKRAKINVSSTLTFITKGRNDSGVRVPLEVPLEFGRTLHSTKTTTPMTSGERTVLTMPSRRVPHQGAREERDTGPYLAFR
jgi:hypothetical protein